jgi:hypothetical protein
LEMVKVPLKNLFNSSAPAMAAFMMVDLCIVQI